MDETLPSLATHYRGPCSRAKRASARRRCRACGPMENEASRRRALARWRTGRPRECDREGHPEPGRKAPGKTTGILPFFKRFQVPMMFVEARVIGRKRPVTLEPKVVSEKEEMLAAELRGV